MIKTVVTCDKCGRKIEGQEHFFLITAREKYLKYEGMLFTEDQFDKTLCEECAEPVVYPTMEPEEKSEEKAAGSEAKKEQDAAVPAKKPAAKKKEAAVKKPKVAPVQPETKEPKQKKVDPTLVKVLLNKGWSKSKIANEMGVTPAAISQAVKRIEGKEL